MMLMSASTDVMKTRDALGTLMTLVRICVISSLEEDTFGTEQMVLYLVPPLGMVAMRILIVTLPTIFMVINACSSQTIIGMLRSLM